MTGALTTARSGVISYLKTGPKSIWETHPTEKSRLIYQLGTADPELAVAAARTVANDVSGVDLNCGCPKDFSVKGGMGAALLTDPDRLVSILEALVAALEIPVSCKIRLLPSQEDTLALVERIVRTGISCLTVHCRTRPMRSTEPALHDRLNEIVEHVTKLTSGRVPVVANGDCRGRADAAAIRAQTGATSVMSARGAEANVSCFRADGPLDPASEVVPHFVRLGLANGQNYPNAKYCLQTMDFKFGRPAAGQAGDKAARSDFRRELASAKTWDELAHAVGIDDIEAARARPIDDLLPLWTVRRDQALTDSPARSPSAHSTLSRSQTPVAEAPTTAPIAA